MLSKIIKSLLLPTLLCMNCHVIAKSPLDSSAPPTINQTEKLTPVLRNVFKPFQVTIEETEFNLPQGIHSYVSAFYEGKYILFAGRTNGLHDFNNNDNNFPPSYQNTTVWVIDPKTKMITGKGLDDPSSKLTQKQIDTLSVTSPQFYQSDSTLYITGGYGIDHAKNTFTTKNVLTAVDLPKLLNWVFTKEKKVSLRKAIRQISHPVFQVTGGYMCQDGKNPTMLVFGQNFEGYYVPSTSGLYNEQVRQFKIHDNGKHFRATILPSKPLLRDGDYRRRDLNILPILVGEKEKIKSKLVAFAGVFTKKGGVWTVPVEIDMKGKAKMADPSLPETFKQAMNHYICASQGLYSKNSKEMYNVLFGGISFGFFQKNHFQTNPLIPFINQVTTIKIDANGNYSQYLMNNEYPVILSKNSHPGNQLLFGAGAQLLVAPGVPTIKNGIIDFDALKKGKTVIGYIIGGIQSTLPNTNSGSDSAASPYIFQVVLTK